MTLLSIVQSAAGKIRIPQPSTVIGNTEENVVLLLEVADIEGKELAKRHTWERTTKEATYTSVAAESQGALSSLGSGGADYSDFDRIIPGTFWNRTANWRITGPLSPAEWQAKKSSSVAGPYNDYRLQGGNLYLYPAPTAGQTHAFEYVSKNWCESSGGTEQSAWAADTDVGLLDEHLMTLGVIWRFKEAQGFAFENDYLVYENSVTQAISRDGGKRVLNLSKRPQFRAGINVPDGNWSP